MPYGVPRTEEERMKIHLEKHGSLENFPIERKGEGTFWKEKIENEKKLKNVATKLGLTSLFVNYALMEYIMGFGSEKKIDKYLNILKNRIEEYKRVREKLKEVI